MDPVFCGRLTCAAPLLSSDLWAHICRFLDIRTLMNLKSSSHALRSAVDDSTRTLVVPFCFLQPQSREVIVGRYFFTTNTVMVMGVTAPVPLRVRLGKAVIRDVVHSDEKAAIETIREILDRTVNSVDVEYGGATPASTGAVFAVETLRYARHDSSHDAEFVNERKRPFFMFSVENVPGQLSSVLLRDMLRMDVEEVYVDERALFPTSPRRAYKANSSLVDGYFADLQCLVHRRIVSFLAPVRPAVEHVEGYNETDPQCGAVRMTPLQCAARFGVAPPTAVERELLPSGSVVVDAGDHLVNLDEFSTYPCDQHDALQHVLLHRVAVMTSGFTDQGKWPTANPMLYCGTLPTGVDVVTSADEANLFFQTRAFSDASATSKTLYIVDNTYLSEVYHSFWYMPTPFLQRVLYSDKLAAGAISLDTAASKLARGKSLATPWILWGSNGSYSSEHVEPHDSCVWVHVFHGLKQWFVFSEERQVWFSFVQRSGQTIFMPRRTRHIVVNLASGTFAIARNYFLTLPE